jgi:hypothetical protein
MAASLTLKPLLREHAGFADRRSEEGASSVVTDAGRGKVFVDEGLELEVRRHLMPLAAFLVQPHPPALAPSSTRTHETELSMRSSSRRACSSVRTGVLPQRTRRAWAAHRMRRVDGEDLADDQRNFAKPSSSAP